jgi:dipeptide/tripeptide permease
MNLGIAAGSFVSPFIRERQGISGVFWVLSGLTFFMLILNMMLFSRKREKEDRYLEYEKEEPVFGQTKSLAQKIIELPFFNLRFIFFIFILLPVRTLFAHQWLTIPDYIMRCYPEGVGARLEWFQGLNPVIIVIFVPLIAAFTRKANIVNMMIIGTLISAVTTFILVPGPNLSALIIYIVLFSFGEAVWSSRFLEYVADLAPAGKVGAYMGLAGIPWFLAKMTTGLYSGIMIDKFIPMDGAHDSGTMWLIYAMIACITPIGLILGKKWVEKGIPQKK